MKDVKIRLLVDNKMSSFTTDKITGKLCSIIVEADLKVDLIIQSELGYLILKRSKIDGLNYYSIRSRVCAPIDQLRDTSHFDKFYLDEKLIITVLGPENTDVGIILRIEE